VASFFVTRFLEQMLYGVSARDPYTFLAVTALLGAVGLLATTIPARRAARVDPMRAMRAD
jgi:putative ABC transport system permease protein